MLTLSNAASYIWGYFQASTNTCSCAGNPTLVADVIPGLPDECGSAYDLRTIRTDIEFYGCSDTAVYGTLTASSGNFYGCHVNCVSGGKAGGIFTFTVSELARFRDGALS